MRPCKKVLLYCSNEDLRSVLSFVLQTRGYGVLGGISAHPPLADVALVVDDGVLSAAVAEGVASCLPDIQILVLSRKEMPLRTYPAHAQVISLDTPMVMINERLRTATCRKRGPKKAVENVRFAEAAVNA